MNDEAVNSNALTNAAGARNLADYTQFIPSSFADIAARPYTRIGAANAHVSAFNCVVTNVPGSRGPLYFAGARMGAMYGAPRSSIRWD